MTLAGRNAIITGANQGLGLEIARAFVDAGAGVLICARDGDRLEAAASELRVRRPGAQVETEPADVTSEPDMTRVVARALQAFGTLQVLVNNAGVYGPIGPTDEIDWASWTRAMEINVNGSVLPSRLVLPHFKSQRYGKIIQISGGGATNPLPRITAYAASKAAIVRFAESLAEEVRDFHIDVNAVAPGALNTRLLDEVLAAGPDRVGAAFHERMVKIKADGGTPMDVGAALTVFLASPESDGISGRLLSAVWDPWRSLPALRDDLAGTDIYTLRRIVPSDRQRDWDVK